MKRSQGKPGSTDGYGETETSTRSGFQLSVSIKRRSILTTIGCLPVLALSAPRAGAAPQTSKNNQPASHSRRVGIAFGGGSFHGIAHVGVLKAFAKKGLKFQFISGTSAGAIVGVLAAAQLPHQEIELIARGIEWPGILNIAWSGKGLMQNANLRSLIDRALGDRRIEQLPIPFGAIATDIATGERVIIRKGPAGAAVGASCSIPVIFEPVKIDERDLVDGGLTEPVPVIAVREMGADIVIGVDVAFRPGEEKSQGLTSIAFQTMQIMANALINEQIRHADVAIRMNLHPLIGRHNAHDQLIAAGYAAAMRAWPKLAPMLV